MWIVYAHILYYMKLNFVLTRRCSWSMLLDCFYFYLSTWKVVYNYFPGFCFLFERRHCNTKIMINCTLSPRYWYIIPVSTDTVTFSRPVSNNNNVLFPFLMNDHFNSILNNFCCKEVMTASTCKGFYGCWNSVTLRKPNTLKVVCHLQHKMSHNVRNKQWNTQTNKQQFSVKFCY